MRHRTWRRSAALLAAPVVLALAACAADGDDAGPSGGWVGGEPAWLAESSAGGAADGDRDVAADARTAAARR